MRSYYRYLRCVKTSVRGRHDGSGRWKVGFYHYCLVMARYCPLPGQLCAIAWQETIRREKEYLRTIISVRPPLSAYNQGRFARKYPTLAFTLHSSQNRLKPR